MRYHVNEAGYENVERNSGEKKAFRVGMEFTSCFSYPGECWLWWYGLYQTTFGDSDGFDRHIFYLL